MKKILLASVMLMYGLASFAQEQRTVVSKNLQDLTMPRSVHLDGYIAPAKTLNGTVSSRNTLQEDIIGSTRYDAQTNGSMAQRIYVTTDGKEGATWTRGLLDGASYSDRGTGYNFFNGTSWLPEPTARIETVRTGWPSIAQWNGNGEIVVAHQSATTPLVLNRRATAGTGAWTQIMVNPPSGAPGLIWPSLITSGANHEFVHMLVLTGPVANGGALYQGLDGALLYFRSSNGGDTWDINGVIIPPLTSANYLGFGADAYAWANPKGDTLAFVVGDNWTDTFLMESFDNGTTWTKTNILSNANKLIPSGTVVEPFYTNDGSNAATIDKNGKVHVVFGRMRASDDGTGKVYYPYTDGLVYWNQDMPMLQDSLNLDTLDAHGQLMGYVVDPGTGDSIHAIPYYGGGMSSYPSITSDDLNNIFVIWSGVTVGNTSPDDMNYRHLWTRGSADGGATWGNMIDLNAGLTYVYREFAFPSMAKNTTSDKIHTVYQTADVPGSAIQTASAPFVVPVHDNNIEHRDVLKSLIVGVSEHNQPAAKIALTNYPNPFRGITNITMQLPQAANVTFKVTNVTGQVLVSLDKGRFNSGIQSFTFDSGSLSSGVYLYSVNINGITYTNRMIVQ